MWFDLAHMMTSLFPLMKLSRVLFFENEAHFHISLVCWLPCERIPAFKVSGRISVYEGKMNCVRHTWQLLSYPILCHFGHTWYFRSWTASQFGVRWYTLCFCRNQSELQQSTGFLVTGSIADISDGFLKQKRWPSSMTRQQTGAQIEEVHIIYTQADMLYD